MKFNALTTTKWNMIGCNRHVPESILEQTQSVYSSLSGHLVLCCCANTDVFPLHFFFLERVRSICPAPIRVNAVSALK